jgi:outer membrane immunogenic protein
MKSTLLGGAACLLSTVGALGADMGVPLAIPPALPPYTWTGCYAGGQAGGGFGHKDLNDSVGIVSSISGFTSANLNISGYMLGGQIGCDYQFTRNWVAGIEGAATGGNIHGSTGVATPGLLGDSATFRETTDLLTSITRGTIGCSMPKAALHGRAIGTVRPMCLRLTTLKDRKRGLAGPRAPAWNGHFQIFGRSGWNTTITGSARVA